MDLNFEIEGGRLFWKSLDVRNLKIEVNTSDFFSASATYYVSGERVFNGFTDELVEPAQIHTAELDNGHIAIVWAMDIWKDNPETGFWDSDYDLFYRVIDPTAGNFVTDEVRLTDSYTHDYVSDLVPDGSGGFSLIWGNEDGEVFDSQSVRFFETSGTYENISGNIILGDYTSEIFFGTDQDDFALLGPGDDVIESGAGSDHLDGGDGKDTAIYSGLASDYDIRLSGRTAEIEDYSISKCFYHNNLT